MAHCPDYCLPIIRQLRKIAKKVCPDVPLGGEPQEPKHCIQAIMFGPSDSGKTTILRNLVMNYGFLDENWEPLENPFNESYMSNIIRPTIYQKLIFNMNLIILEAHKRELEMEFSENEDRARYLLETQTSSMSDLSLLNEELKNNLKQLWKDATIRKVYNDYRTSFSITGNLAYFMNKLDVLSDQHYVPSQEDLLHTRRPTVCNRNYYFIIDKVKFKITDAGGNDQQRMHYPEYIQEFLRDRPQCAVAAHVVIYVANLSDYNQLMTEKHKDELNPRNMQQYTHMDESQRIFRILASLPELADSMFLLFLNKSDIFQNRLSQFKDFKKYFPQCQNPNDPECAVRHVREYFEEGLQAPTKLHNDLLSQQTCATDKQVMRKIITIAKMKILQEVFNRIAQTDFN